MKDTAYFVPPTKIERLVHAYRSEGDRLVLFDWVSRIIVRSLEGSLIHELP